MGLTYTQTILSPNPLLYAIIYFLYKEIEDKFCSVYYNMTSRL